MDQRRPLLRLVAVAATLLVAGCGSDDDPSTATSLTTASSAAPTTTASEPTSTTSASVTMAGETVPVARLLAVAAGLCEALQQAPTDVAAAKRTFNSRSHDGLHLIARGLEEIDRAAAAALLEAKQKVEADFSRSAAPAQVTTDLRALADVTRSSLARFEVSAEPCPSS